MAELTRGANAPLSNTKFETVLRWPTAAGSLDASVFLVGETGHVRDDSDMIFYNQPTAQNDCVQLIDSMDGLARFSVSPSDIPGDVARVVFCLTVDGTDRSMSNFNGIEIVIETNANVTHRFKPDLAEAAEIAIMVAELYRRDDKWKIRAVAQGFRGGLAALATSLGIDVEGESHDTPEPPQAVQAPDPSPPPPSVREPFFPNSSTDDLDIIEIEPAKRQVRTANVRWLAPDDTVDVHVKSGRLCVTLDWRWWVGGTDGRVRPVSLALGAAYATKHGTRGAVQLPNSRGQLDRDPWVMVAPGSPRGADAGQERLIINLDEQSDFEKIDVYAFISKGTATWLGCEVWLNITGPFPTPLEYRVDPYADGQAAIGLLRIVTDATGCTIRRLNRFGADQAELDFKLEWGLEWRTATSG